MGIRGVADPSWQPESSIANNVRPKMRQEMRTHRTGMENKRRPGRKRRIGCHGTIGEHPRDM